MALHPELWHLPGESHVLMEGPFHPTFNGYESNRVDGENVDPRVICELRSRFYSSAINLNEVLPAPARLMSGSNLLERAATKLLRQIVGVASRYKKPRTIRFLEKTPKNSLRVPLLELLFPDAQYIWIKRRAEDNIDSLIAGWRAVDRIGPFKRRRFSQAGYPIAKQLNLKDYSDKWWKFALVPGWKDLQGKTVADVAAWQYYQCNRTIIDDLANVESERVFSIRYEDLISQPVELLREINARTDLPPSRTVEEFALMLPRVNEVPRRGSHNHSLRYPDSVKVAIERLNDLRTLQREMGYVS